MGGSHGSYGGGYGGYGGYGSHDDDDDCYGGGSGSNPDGYVEGTSGNDTIDASYDGDPDGDHIDNDDAILDGETGDDDIVLAGGGSDSVLSGAGDDEVYAGSGHDTVEAGSGDDMVSGGTGNDDLYGGSGNDVIYGDTGAASDGVREDFDWDKLRDYYGNSINDGEKIYNQIQDTGQVNVTFSTSHTNGSPQTSYRDDVQNIDGVRPEDGGSVDSTSGMLSYLDQKGESATYTFKFSAEVDDVSFRINDIDLSSKVIIRAYDADGNLVEIDVDAGSKVIATDEDSAGGTETLLSGVPYSDYATNAGQTSALVTIPGPVTKIEIVHTQVASGTAGILMTDMSYDVTPDYVDGSQTTSSDGNDEISGGSGDDTVFGEGGDDTITDGAGADLSYGGADRDTFIGASVGDHVDGGESGDDYDTLDLRGLKVTVEQASGDDEAGTVTFYDDENNVTGTMTYENIENVLTDPNPPNPTSDGIVMGTTGDDSIDTAYDGDPDGDFVDNDDAIIVGDSGDDDVIHARSGDDTVAAGEGSDEVYGGAGNDSIGTGSASQALDHETFDGIPYETGDDQRDDLDWVDGGSGDDTISTGDDADTIFGGTGHDSIDGGIDDDLIYGGAGNDTIDGTQTDSNLGSLGNDEIWGGSGDDSIVAGMDLFSDYSGDDPNLPYSFDPSATSDPNPYDERDTVYGGSGNDTILTGDDADLIHGGSGEDLIYGGIDDDTIIGEMGADVIFGGHGSDSIQGNSGDDVIDASASTSGMLYSNEPDATDPLPGNDKDTVSGGRGDDSIITGDDDDVLYGESGDDTLDAGIDDDSIYGGRGADVIYAGSGDDLVEGASGDDEISAGAGADVVTGGAGNDTIANDGDDDVDMIYGGGGRDVITGAGIGDVIDGGSSGDDYDTLDLTGSAPAGGRIEIKYTSPDQEDGKVEYYDADNNLLGTSTFTDIENIVPCFTPGTLIATPRGEVPVEELQAGDRVITRDNGMQPIRWIGTRHLKGGELLKARHLQPVLIRRGALGHGLPERDMVVSPNHRMLINNDKTALYFEDREVLVSAKHLTGLSGVERLAAEQTTYIHFLFEQHEVVLSDGAWSESFQPGHQTMDGLGNAQRNEIWELFPELKGQEGLQGYGAARKTLKRHEAELLTLD
ncbi:Hint domain-containing protein [Oceanicola sp. S124]|uniref:Hint domain-containing protein n=1 Tax=Oceanicola sp. S124 TaxID=1042378 RepID=UPI0002559116|nr:Hint domain-containing protein [Oceanicola sp. S124]